MRDVYSQATKVLIWLGEASEEVGTPLHDSKPTLPVSEIFLEFLGEMVIELRHLRRAGQDPEASLPYQELLSQASEKYETDLFRGFGDILHRRWWSRVWVTQEVFLARSATIVCSKQSANYRDFIDLYEIFSGSTNLKAMEIWSWFGLGNDQLGHARYADTDGESIWLLYKLLRGVFKLQVSDSRDRIFGILGLSSGFKALLPSPDYGRTTTEVYADVAELFLTRARSLCFLALAPGNISALDHPSWVSD